MKYYSVRIGKNPGVYQSWEECKKEIDGFPSAVYKSFKTEAEARAFLQEDVSQKVKKSLNTEKCIKSETQRDLPEGPYAFIDGSFNADHNIYGYGGFLNVKGRLYPLMGSDNQPDMAAMRNVAGELLGAMAAVRKAEELHLREVTLLYDYKGIEQWVPGHGTWKATKEGTKKYRDFMNPANRLTTVHFQKVAAHTGIKGNEVADTMAKIAVGITVTNSARKEMDALLSQGKV